MAVPAPATPPAPSLGGDHLSVSQLSMYLRCSMQWYFRYVLKLRERPNLAILNGKAGHTAVEHNGRKKISTGQDQPLEKLLDVFSDAYDAETAQLEPSDLEPGDDLGETKDKTTETLKIWRAIEAPQIQPLAVEAELKLIVPNEDGFELDVPPIVGRIDTIERRGVTDNKFTSRMKSQDEVDLSDQLTTYDAALIQKGIKPGNVGLTVFVPPGKTVPPKVQTIWRRPELMTPNARASRIERVYYKFRTAWRGIKAGIFLPADDPKTCGWCGYRDRCQYSLVKSDYDAIAARQK